MQKYFTIFFTLLKYNLIREMEFRKNFYIRLVTQIFFVILQIVIVDTFFRFTTTIGSWSKSEVFVLVGIFRLIEGAFHMFIHSNLLSLPELVNSGELDLLLSKPVHSLFLVSLQRHQLYETSTFLSGIVILLYTGLINNFSWINVILLASLGLIALYAVMLFFASMSFFVPRLTALNSIWDVISKTARFPLDIFFGSSRFGLFLAAPLILVATLPSQLVLGKLPPIYLTYQIFGTAILLFLSYSFWRFALRHYSSASS